MKSVARVLSGAFSLGVIVSLSGCVSMIPVDEYTIARAALEAAKESEAPRYAPSLW